MPPLHRRLTSLPLLSQLAQKQTNTSILNVSHLPSHHGHKPLISVTRNHTFTFYLTFAGAGLQGVCLEIHHS